MQPTIIIADDDALFRLIMRRYLTALGFNVIDDESGKKVISQINTYAPVACILDMFMDDKDGIETILELAELPNKPKLIAVSSNAFYLNAAKDFGVDAVLIKPIDQDQLIMVLDLLGVRAP